MQNPASTRYFCCEGILLEFGYQSSEKDLDSKESQCQDHRGQCQLRTSLKCYFSPSFICEEVVRDGHSMGFEILELSHHGVKGHGCISSYLVVPGFPTG